VTDDAEERARELEAARTAAHKLVGSLGTFGFPRGSELAVRIEGLLDAGPGPADGGRLADLVADMRTVLDADPIVPGGATTTPPNPARAVPDGSPAATVDVALVEDDPALAELLRHALELQDLTTRWIADGATAARALAGDAPELVPRVLLLDVDLPGLNGLALLQELARRGRLRTMRTIMLTARASEPEVVAAFELGAFDHVAKPFSLPILQHRIRRALERG